MSEITIQEIEFVPVVKFKENEIIFFQDMQLWKGVPADIPFMVEKNPTGFTFIADGYGSKKDYGNGSIMIKDIMLPEYFHQWYNTQTSIK